MSALKMYNGPISNEQAVKLQLNNMCHHVSLATIKKAFDYIISTNFQIIEKPSSPSEESQNFYNYQIQRHLENLIYTYGVDEVSKVL